MSVTRERVASGLCAWLLALSAGSAWAQADGGEEARFSWPLAVDAADADEPVDGGALVPTGIADPQSAPSDGAASAQTAPVEQTQAPEASPIDDGPRESSTTVEPSAEVEAEPDETVPLLETVVVGTSEAQTSGAVHLIKDEKLQQFEYNDPQAVLKLVPGVYGRGEDGFGLRPNIGLRGANSDRSKKVTLLEDGVLFGPAPYSAPAAYYFPLVTRMQSVRVLKGPSAIMHGPQTVGGTIEFLTRDVPYDADWGLDLAGGQYLSGKLHGFYGASNERSGVLLEGVHLRSSGFKELDGGGNTGFYRNEWMAKARHRLDALGDFKQSLQLKLGYSDEASNETYLGLTDADFRDNPLRRYQASQLDRMEWHRTQVALSHRLEKDDLAIITTAYRHDFDRAWRKLNRFVGSPVSNVLEDPQSARNSLFYSVLTGQTDSTSAPELLLIGPNQRVFVSQGLQSVGRWSVDTGPVRHNVEFGARYHYDSITRLHTEDTFRTVGERLVFEPTPTATTADNFDSTHALALHAVDALSVGRLTFTPGLRAELIRSRSVDRLADTRGEGQLDILLPGLGVHAQVIEQLGLFAGAHRGFSPPPPGEAAAPEESLNYEAGARWTRLRERIELIGFFNDYANLTNVCTFSNGCLGGDVDAQFAAGRARIWGLEAFAEKTFRPKGWGVAFPLTLAYTFTQTELLTSFQSRDPQFGAVTAGDELPYVPTHQGFASVIADAYDWAVYVNASYTGQMREEAGQGELEPSLTTDALLTFDVGANVRLSEEAQLYLNVQNVFDELGIVSRRPYGARPNAPRTVIAGFKYSM